MGGPGSGRRPGSGRGKKGVARKSNKAFLNKLKKNRERDSKTSNSASKSTRGSFKPY
jgi:hypothetical protein